MTINRRTVLAGVASGLAAGLVKQPAFAATSYDPGASDKEVRIGQFGPLSGPSLRSVCWPMRWTPISAC
jgi:branched-chain amino acid transport system substrate-binding protein